MKKEVERLHFDTFGQSDKLQFYFCPGRVNFIGEHIDYNGGSVMPFAISQGIYACVELIDEPNFYLQSENLGTEKVSFEQVKNETIPGNWSIYPLGVASILTRKNVLKNGLRVTFKSNLPQGAGLSSSAAIEVLFGFILSDTQNWGLEPFEIAIASQQAEWEFPKVKCGIMDQFAVAMSKENHILKLDCENLNYVFLPFELGLELLILDTKVPRTLAASAYNKRVEECEQALNILYQTHQVRSFTDVKVEMLEAIQNKVLKKRAKHIVSEIERVELTSKYLSENNHIALGELLNQSHFSLRDDYEVSCDELDFITEYARKQTGCYGARMTGAGFGGCAIALIEPQYAESISQKISEFYQNEYGYFPSIYKSKPENGVRKL